MNTTLFWIHEMLLAKRKESGALVLALSHLRLLLAHPHIQVELWYLSTEAQEEAQESLNWFFETYLEHPPQYRIVALKKPQPAPSLSQRLKAWMGTDRQAMLDQYFPLSSEENQKRVGEALKTPDNPSTVIWAEHLLPALLALETSSLPVIYGQHDFMHKIVRMRAGKSLIRRLRSWRVRTSEQAMIRHCAAYVAGSSTELAELQAIGSKGKPAFYAPTTFPAPQKQGDYVTQPRLVHLGSFGTTANKVGVAYFVREVQPLLKHEVALDLIGNPRGMPRVVEQAIAADKAQSLGFVDDLSQALRPGDLHLIPYTGNTGTRTRLPLVLAHGQLLIAMRPAVEGFRGLESGKNCLLASSAREMAQQIDAVLDAPKEYQRLAQAGRRLYEQEFTLEGQLPRFKEWWGRLEIR